MFQALKLHPTSRCSAVTNVEVGIMRKRRGELVLHYFVKGRLADLRLPPKAAPARTDELWRHTCFEAFVRPLPGDAYYEFNFAPSMQWAAYHFDGYRNGMRAADAAPQIAVQSDDAALELQVTLDGLSDAVPWRLGLSAVIEETTGRISYWALAHPPGKPDFHHADCFALELANGG